MWIVVVLGLAGFWFWRSNKRRAYRFVRSVHFLDKLDQGVGVNEANEQVGLMFTKNSTQTLDENATLFALDRAQRWTDGKQLPWIHEARQKGFTVDSGNTKLDGAHLYRNDR